MDPERIIEGNYSDEKSDVARGLDYYSTSKLCCILFSLIANDHFKILIRSTYVLIQAYARNETGQTAQ